ncbi:MAG: hypothetical protein KQJ78_12245 [Deltaproteobacteria bacterium]|nr:hypothetical protein [Deltaproteobacteria bacterium]
MTRPPAPLAWFAAPGPDPGRVLGGLFTAFVLVAGLGTVYCNLCVYTGRDFDFLTQWSFLPLLAAAGLTWRFRRRPPRPPAAAVPAPAPAPGGLTSRRALILWATALGVAAAYVLSGSYLVVLLGGAAQLVFLRHGPWQPDPATPPPPVSRGWWLGLVGLLLAAVAYTLCSHRPDIDDSAYLNFVVTTLDHPAWPLLSRDGMFGPESFPIYFPIYRAHSFELLVALATRLTGLSHFTLYYLVLPALGAGLVVAGHAWIFHRWLPRGSLAAVAFVVLALVVWGDAHRAFGNFAFVRMFQGKAYLVSLVVPLIIYFAVAYLERPGWRAWILLALAQVAAVGFSSTALLVAPLACLLALAGGWRPQRRQTLVVLAGALSVLYVLGLGLLVTREVKSLRDFAVTSRLELLEGLTDSTEATPTAPTGPAVKNAPAPPAATTAPVSRWNWPPAALASPGKTEPRPSPPGAPPAPTAPAAATAATAAKPAAPPPPAPAAPGTPPVSTTRHFLTTAQNQLGEVAGTGLRSAAAIFAVAGFGLALGGGLRRRTLLGLGLGLLLVLLNTWLGDFLARFAFQNLRWRLMWCFPLPLFLGLTAGGLYNLGAGTLARAPEQAPPVRRYPPWAGLAAWLCFCLAFALVPGRWTTSALNGNHLHWPGYKVEGWQPWAEELTRRVPAKGVVLAPPDLGRWLLTVRHHPPLLVYTRYPASIIRVAGNREYWKRRRLERVVSGRETDPLVGLWAVREILRRRLPTVVFSSHLALAPLLTRGLAAAGYQAADMGVYRLMIRPAFAPPPAALAARVPAGGLVLAPPEVEPRLLARQGNLTPVYQKRYPPEVSRHLNRRELHTRGRLMRVVSGLTTDPLVGRWAVHEIIRSRIPTVVFPADLALAPLLTKGLVGVGYKSRDFGVFRLLVQPDFAPPPAELAARVPAGGQVLAPPNLGRWLLARRDDLPLVHHDRYPAKLWRTMTRPDFLGRQRLDRVVSGLTTDPLLGHWAVREIIMRRIATVVFPRDLALAPLLTEGLVRDGYKSQDFGAFRLLVQPDFAPPPAELAARLPAGGQVLAPLGMGPWLLAHQGKLIPVYQRRFPDKIWRHMEYPEFRQRVRLMRVVSGLVRDPLLGHWAVQEIIRRRIPTVVFPVDLALAPLLTRGLTQAGYQSQDFGPFRLLVQPAFVPPAAPAAQPIAQP